VLQEKKSKSHHFFPTENSLNKSLKQKRREKLLNQCKTPYAFAEDFPSGDKRKYYDAIDIDLITEASCAVREKVNSLSDVDWDDRMNSNHEEIDENRHNLSDVQNNLQHLEKSESFCSFSNEEEDALEGSEKTTSKSLTSCESFENYELRISSNSITTGKALEQKLRDIFRGMKVSIYIDDVSSITMPPLSYDCEIPSNDAEESNDVDDNHKIPTEIKVQTYKSHKAHSCASHRSSTTFPSLSLHKSSKFISKLENIHQKHSEARRNGIIFKDSNAFNEKTKKNFTASSESDMSQNEVEEQRYNLVVDE
jgi:hypothetical protein